MPVSFLINRAKILSLAPVITQFLFALLVTLGAVSGGAWGGIGIGGALLLALAVGVGTGRFPSPGRAAVWSLAAFFAFAALSSFQAIDPGVAWHTTLRMATILLPLSFLLNPDVQRVAAKALPRLSTLLLLSFSGLLLLAVLTGLGIVFLGYNDTDLVTKLNRGFSYLLMLGWPLGAAFFHFRWQKGPVAIWKLCVFLAVFLLALGLNHSRAAQTGAVLSLGVFGVAFWLPRIALGGLAVVTLVASLWPFAASWLYANQITFVLSLPESWLARIEIWDYMSYRILERPLLGYGLGNSAKLSFENPHSSLYIYAVRIAAHPHNAMTQLMGELGLPGLGFGLLFAFGALRGLWRLPAGLRPAAMAAFALTLWLTMTAYNFWTDSLWAAMALTGFAFAVLRRGEEELKLL